ncbi:MAG: hypothetical protein V4714_16170 [Bacteroidota bacterium]
MRHRHGEKDFRGVAWWKRNKDPKIGEDYKDPNLEDQKKVKKATKRRQKEVEQKKKDSQEQ